MFTAPIVYYLLYWETSFIKFYNGLAFVCRLLLLLFCCGSSMVNSYVMSGRSVNPSTLFLGRLRPPKRLTSTWCNTVTSNRQLSFLNRQKNKRNK